MDHEISSQAVLDCVVEHWAEQSLPFRYSDALQEALQETLDCTSALATPNASLTALPALCCRAVADQPIEGTTQVTAAWLLYYTAARLLDDVADNKAFSPDLGVGVTINLAAGLIVSAGELLWRLPDAASSEAIREMFASSVLAMCSGQHLALVSTTPPLQMCWSLAELRSGAFFAAAAWAGARLGTFDETRLSLFKRYGHELGMLLQIGDDLKDLWPRDGCRSDLAAGSRWTLPIGYAMAVLPECDCEELAGLLKRASSDPGAETAARRRLLANGAATYLAVEVERRRTRARQALTAAVPLTPTCAALLEEVASRCVVLAGATSAI